MLSDKQLKAIELLVTGHTVKDVSQHIGVTTATINGWKNNPEFIKELSTATDIYAKECLKSRSRAYRAISKKLTDEIIQRVDNGELKEYSIIQLLKMLEKTVATMDTDENAKKINSLTAIQNNIQINDAGLNEKLKDPDMIKKFGQFLIELDPDSIETIVEVKNKHEEKLNDE